MPHRQLPLESLESDVGMVEKKFKGRRVTLLIKRVVAIRKSVDARCAGRGKSKRYFCDLPTALAKARLSAVAGTHKLDMVCRSSPASAAGTRQLVTIPASASRPSQTPRRCRHARFTRTADSPDDGPAPFGEYAWARSGEHTSAPSEGHATVPGAAHGDFSGSKRR